jgi:hypothetical protein
MSKSFLRPPLKRAVSRQLSANKNAFKKCNLINLLVAERCLLNAYSSSHLSKRLSILFSTC